MPDINKLLEGLNLELSDDQKELMNKAQTALDSEVATDLETSKKGVLNKNQELIDKLKAAKDNAIPDGFDMDGYTDYTNNKDQILADKAKAEEDKLIATQNWDKLKNTMNNEHDSAIVNLTKEKDITISGLRLSLDNELIENISIKAIDAEKGSQVLLMPHVKDRIRTYQDESGKYFTKVVDLSGNDSMDEKTGNPVTVSELIAEFKANAAFAGAFPIQNRGSGSVVTVDGKNYNAKNNPFDKQGGHYSLTEQSKLRRTNPTLAKALEKQT